MKTVSEKEGERENEQGPVREERAARTRENREIRRNDELVAVPSPPP